MLRRFSVAAAVLASCFSPLSAAELLFPQERQAFYSHEPIELAVTGLPEGAKAVVELVPTRAAVTPISFDVLGKTGTTTVEVTSGSLAPDVYVVKLDGKEIGKLTISSGVIDSTLLVSQTASLNELKAGGANFFLGNAFSFGRLNPRQDGPSLAPRGTKTVGMRVFEDAIAANLPTVVYMYWTGYVTHKPFGSMKSWAAAEMNDSMRLLSFHTSQRVRRFAPNIISVGTLDEPGLGWGKTPAGGTASGFPDWDEQAWYEQRGWQFTDDPASRADDDWLKYMTIRCEIMRDCQRQARRDLKTPWPQATFSTDLYAPHAIMDGTDPLNQEVNDLPASHVFVDWGIDRLGAYSGVQLEKSHDPTSRMAHAMNGQLFGDPVAPPQQTHAYRAAVNGMLAAGLTSNWWLNTGVMKPADLAEVNNAAKKIGPVFKETMFTGHDVAVLWSFTELAMRQKDITLKESRKKTGEQIKRMIVSLPENTALQEKEIDINAYHIGGDYKESVLTAHYALARAGFPAQIIHERTLPYGALKTIKTLVIVGQTHALPDTITEHLKKFSDAGGRIIVDKSTTQDFRNAIVADVDLRGLSYRWSVLFLQDAKSFKTPREASLFQTNHFMDEPVRNAVAPLKAAMRQTASKLWAETDSTELLIEHQRGGEGTILLAINGYEELPAIADDKKYPIYNYAPYSPKFALRLPALSLEVGRSTGANPQSSPVVFTLEGPNFDRSIELADPAAPIAAKFEPGEMKVYFVAPRKPEGIAVAATVHNGTLAIEATLKRLSMPWPIVVSITDPTGQELFRVNRSTNLTGKFYETFPLGANAPSGEYVVKLTSVVANLAGETKAAHQSKSRVPRAVANVRVFDAERLKDFLLTKPEFVVATHSNTPADAVRLLTDRLAIAGLKVTVKPESEVLRKVAYPRVWNPYAKVFTVSKTKEPTALKFDKEITLNVDASGSFTAKTADGQDVSNDWRLPNARITIVGEGFVDFSGDVEQCYEPGVQLHVNEQRQVTSLNADVTEVKTSTEFRARWAKPWSKLTQHVGAYQLPAQLPEAYTTDSHLIVLGSSTTSHAVALLQASELLPQIADEKYPGPGGALVSLCWSPFAVEKNAIVLASSDLAGLKAAVEALTQLLK
ncbi:MAG: hypothetical protein FJ302_10145 [Planctomycetes bacterium]|nr:hypothetical protein [Planctomycetota bacterium]